MKDREIAIESLEFTFEQYLLYPNIKEYTEPVYLENDERGPLAHIVAESYGLHTPGNIGLYFDGEEYKVVMGTKEEYIGFMGFRERMKHNYTKLKVIKELKKMNIEIKECVDISETEAVIIGDVKIKIVKGEVTNWETIKEREEVVAKLREIEREEK